MALSIIFFAQFRAGFLSKLAVKRRMLPLSSIQSIEDTSYKMGIRGGGNIQSYFEKASSDTLSGRLWRNHILPYSDDTLLSDIQLGFDKTASEDEFSFLAFRRSGILSPNYPCGIVGLDEVFLRSVYIYAYQKNSPLTEMFDYYLLKLKEIGVVDRIIKKYTDVPEVDCVSEVDRSLDFKTVFGIFSILLSGTCCAFLLTFCEKCCRFTFPQFLTKYDEESMLDLNPKTLTSLQNLVRALKLEIEEKDKLIAKLKKE